MHVGYREKNIVHDVVGVDVGAALPVHLVHLVLHGLQLVLRAHQVVSQQLVNVGHVACDAVHAALVLISYHVSQRLDLRDEVGVLLHGVPDAVLVANAHVDYIYRHVHHAVTVVFFHDQHGPLLQSFHV